jgi:hypothetical protein
MNMKKHSQLQGIGGAFACLALCVSPVFASTGPFTSPLTTAFLSVDLNGGPIASAAAPTEGWNGSFSSPAFSADQYGVTWSPWGGPVNTYGDGTQLPSSQSSPNINASSLSKTFGSITATLSIDTTLNSSKYGTVNGVASMNSRDRGGQTGVTYLPPASSDGDVFRDFVFAGGSGSQVQGENFLKLTLSGLTPGGSYEIAMYSFDGSGGHSGNWTATAPTASNNLLGWWAGSPPGNNTFTAPADEQTITWTGGGTNNFQAPAIFTLTADGTGSLSVWGWGGDGISGDQSGDTTYLNGFQIAQIPEPSCLALLSLGALLVGRLANSRRRNA